MTKLPKMSVKTFVNEGYLQELNRRFLHPIGVALGFYVPDDDEPDTDEPRAFFIDARNDPEGMTFASGQIDFTKIQKINTQQMMRRGTRLAATSFWVQGDVRGKDESSVPTAFVHPAKPHRFSAKDDSEKFADVCVFCGDHANAAIHDPLHVMMSLERELMELKADIGMKVLLGVKAVLNGYNPMEERAEAYAAGQQSVVELHREMVTKDDVATVRDAANCVAVDIAALKAIADKLERL